MEIFIYEGNELAIIKKDDDKWFRAKTVANILKYSNQRKQSSIMLILKINAH